jgi:hypothetical protein
MKKQRLLNRAVKITVLSMLTFALYFNFGIEIESGELWIPSIKSITLGNSVFAQDYEGAPTLEGGDRIAKDCKYTGYHRDKCSYGIYLISNCREKITIMETSDCGY